MSRMTSANNEIFAKPAIGTAWSDYLTLTKARIAGMVVITAAVGFALAQSTLDWASWSWIGLIGSLLGTAMSCMGAGSLNQLIERELDRRMPRTSDRPIPAGRMSPAEACWIGCGLSLAGVGILLVCGTALAAAISALTVLGYAFIYTPLKTRTWLALFVGAVPGAAPPLIGYAAAAGTLSAGAWAIFAIMFLWQIPHFLAIGWLYREDYAKAGMPMIPVVDPTGKRTGRHVLGSCLVLVPTGFLPSYLGLGGPVYFGVAMVLGIGFLTLGTLFWMKQTRPRARWVFFASLAHLPLILGVLAFSLVY